jgi:hypothetical protein
VPTLNAYLTWYLIWLLAVLTLRLPRARRAGGGAATLPAGAYRTAGSSVLRIALSAISILALFYNRVAHSSISYPTILLAALLCIMLGLRQMRWPWFAAGGALLGLGIYAYNVDAIALVAAAAFFVAMALLRFRRAGELRRWCAFAGITAGGARRRAPASYVANPDALLNTSDYRTPASCGPEYHDAELGRRRSSRRCATSRRHVGGPAGHLDGTGLRR